MRQPEESSILLLDLGLQIESISILIYLHLARSQNYLVSDEGRLVAQILIRSEASSGSRFVVCY